MSRTSLWIAVGSFLLVPLGVSLAWSSRTSEGPPQILLSAHDIKLAREIAERDLNIVSQAISPSEQTFFIKVDYLPEGAARLVMVHHYCYRNDETIFTMVDLNSGQVVSRERAVRYPTALAPAELRRALELTRQEERLQSMIADRNLELQGKPMQVSADEPRYGHRLVLVMLREQGQYLETPMVLVDLHDESVQIVD